MSLLGLDIGTSGCKATLLDIEGKIQGDAYKEYGLASPQPGWYELDANIVWKCVKEVIMSAASHSKKDKIKAISVSSFGEAAVPIDRNGNILHNSIIYIDIRGQEEADYLKGNLGFERILGITGASIHPMYTICKIMWLKKNRPDIYDKTWKFLLFADLILFMLGAGPRTDYSLAARTMAFDVIEKKWSQEILNCAGIDADKFGEPVQAASVVGEILPGIADELGLPKGMLLVAGGHDQACAALGAGVIKSGIAVDGLGTTECITPAFDRPVISDIMAKSCFACVPHVIKNMYVTYAFSYTSGSMLKWFRDNFGYEYKEIASRTGVNVYDVMIDNAAAFTAGLYVLPHFAGAATPYMDTEAKGAIIGLNIATKPADIIKAILEGITFEMMVNLERLEKAGIETHELRAVGGLARSESFLQLKADIMGRRVISLDNIEAGTLGVAILAGKACGEYGSLEEAVERLVKKKREFYPNTVLNKIYKEKFITYKKIYPSVKYIFSSGSQGLNY